MEKLPQKGDTYNFYDDGKIGRKYTAQVIRVIPFNESNNITFKARLNDDGELSTYYNKECGIDDQYIYEKSLCDIWSKSVIEISWVFADKTDYFVECSIPEYDEDTIWFARTKGGGWFSMDIQNSWQGGRLDVENKYKTK